MNEAASSADRLKELSTAPIWRILLKYSLPAVTGIVVTALYNIIDSIVIGHAIDDPNVVAGIAVTFPVMNLSSALGMLIGAGAATRVSIVMGQDDRRMAEIILGNCVQLTLIIGLTYTTLFTIFLDPILRAFGASDASLPYAREFLLWAMPALVLINITFSYNNVMRASGYPSKAMYTNMIGAVINAILAPLFLFGFGWGIRGAAIATDIAMLITAIWVMSHFFQKKNTLHFAKGTFKLQGKVIRSVLYIGMAPFLINVAGAGINAIINNSLMKYGGDNAIAAVVVFNRYVTIFVFIVIGICQGMQPILGYNYGMGKRDRLFKTLRLAAKCSLIITCIGDRSSMAVCYRRHVHARPRADRMRCQLSAHHDSGLLDGRFSGGGDQFLPVARHGRQGCVSVAYAPDSLHGAAPLHSSSSLGTRRCLERFPDLRCGLDIGGCGDADIPDP